MTTSRAAVLVAAAVCLGTLSSTPAQASPTDPPRPRDGWTQQRRDAVTATNQERTQSGLEPLTLTTTLNAVAQDCAEKVVDHLASTGQLAHCDGSLPGISDYAVRMPKGWTMVNENVSAHPLGASGDASVDLLLDSTPNRIVLMTPGMTHVGVGVAEKNGWRVYVHNYGAYRKSPGPAGTGVGTTLPPWWPKKLREVWGP